MLHSETLVYVGLITVGEGGLLPKRFYWAEV